MPPLDTPNQTHSVAGKVLVAESDRALQEQLVFRLHQEGYEVLSAADGVTAFELIQQSKYDRDNIAIELLILDVELPYLNGLDLCQVLRDRGNNLSILMLGADDNESSCVKGLETGADDYLAKPFGIAEFLARCHALLRRQWNFQSWLAAEVFKVGEIKLDLRSHQVTVRGAEVVLAPREFRLLEFFMRQPHRMLTRETLIKKVWGEDVTVGKKTVEMSIHELRTQLELDPEHPKYLVTVRKRGYRFG